MKSPWFAAAGMLVLALAVAMCWDGAPQPTHTTPNLAAPGGSSERTAADRQRGNAAAKQPTLRTAADAEGSSHTLEVLVVDTDGNAVADATVRYWPARAPDERAREDSGAWESEDPEVAMARSAAAVRTDGEGIARIDAAHLDAEHGSQLIARHGARFGLGWISATDRRRLVELRPDVGFAIEVVDSLGRARPGQVVRLVAEFISPRTGLQRAEWTTGPSNARGRIRVAHAQLDLELSPDATAGHVVATCERRTSDTTTVRLAECTLDLPQLGPDTPVKLVVPAGGAIAVRAKGADGAPTIADVWLRDEQGECFDLEPAAHDDAQWFHGLPLHRRWSVVVRPDHGDDTIVPVVGPTAADEVIEVVPPAQRLWRFVARLVRNDGLPIPAATIRCSCPELSIDDSFASSGDRVHLHGSSDRLTTVTHAAIEVASPFATRASFRFDGRFAPGRHDLGDLVVSPPIDERLLASLQIRCDGEPLTAGVRLRLWADGPDPKHAPELPFLVRRNADRLELVGALPPQPLQLACDHDDCIGTRVPILGGEHRIIDLQRAAALHVAVVPPDVPWDRLSASLQPLDAPGDPIDNSLDRESQTFDWLRLAPGRYRLRIEALGHPVHDEAELVLTAGENEWPTARTRLDLKTRLRACCIVAHSAGDRTRLVRVAACVVPAGTTVPPDTTHTGHNDNVFVPHHGPADLLVSARGFVPLRMPDPRRDVVLELQPWTTLAADSAAAGQIELRIRVVEHGVRDPELRAFDSANDYDEVRDDFLANRPSYAPGTVLDLCVLRQGEPGPAQRIVVGTSSPQLVALR